MLREYSWLHDDKSPINKMIKSENEWPEIKKYLTQYNNLDINFKYISNSINWRNRAWGIDIEEKEEKEEKEEEDIIISGNGIILEHDEMMKIICKCINPMFRAAENYCSLKEPYFSVRFHITKRRREFNSYMREVCINILNDIEDQLAQYTDPTNIELQIARNLYEAYRNIDEDKGVFNDSFELCLMIEYNASKRFLIPRLDKPGLFHKDCCFSFTNTIKTLEGYHDKYRKSKDKILTTIQKNIRQPLRNPLSLESYGLNYPWQLLCSYANKTLSMVRKQIYYDSAMLLYKDPDCFSLKLENYEQTQIVAYQMVEFETLFLLNISETMRIIFNGGLDELGDDIIINRILIENCKGMFSILKFLHRIYTPSGGLIPSVENVRECINNELMAWSLGTSTAVTSRGSLNTALNIVE